MASQNESKSAAAWALFDQAVADFALKGNPWRHDGAAKRFEPDTELLKLLLTVPRYLGLASTTSIPALALDVWIAAEYRRAGFSPNRIWPRPASPRVLPAAAQRLIDGLPGDLAVQVRAELAKGKTLGGAVSANARVLGKNYFKQVDTGMSDWDTGPELLVSTKRMDKSFSRNAANRVEESYGDAKNLRLRHPQAVLGYVYALNSVAFDEAPNVSAWIVDLLQKLGREDDAYDAVMLLAPNDAGPGIDEGDPEENRLAEAGIEQKDEDTGAARMEIGDYAELFLHPRVELNDAQIPDSLSPAAFFERTIHRVLERSPIDRHEEARTLLGEAEAST